MCLRNKQSTDNCIKIPFYFKNIRWYSKLHSLSRGSSSRIANIDFDGALIIFTLANNLRLLGKIFMAFHRNPNVETLLSYAKLKSTAKLKCIFVPWRQTY